MLTSHRPRLAYSIHLFYFCLKIIMRHSILKITLCFFFLLFSFNMVMGQEKTNPSMEYLCLHLNYYLNDTSIIDTNFKDVSEKQFDSLPKKMKIKFDPSIFIPISYWVGTNYTLQKFNKLNTLDTFTAQSMSIEAGLGWYDYDSYIRNLMGNWSIYGGGIGFEYRVPFENKWSLIEKSGYPYRQFYLNARIEMGIGGYIGPLLLCGHAHLGYTTDFLYHYIRTGIGLSLGRLQLGVEALLPINTNHFYTLPQGFYGRYILDFYE
jgi:hypothetical protein